MFRYFLIILFFLELFSLLIFSKETNLKREPEVRGGYTKCSVYEYDYVDGRLDSSSGKKIKFLKFNNHGFITEENSFSLLNYHYNKTYFKYDDKMNLNYSVNISIYDSNSIDYKYNSDINKHRDTSISTTEYIYDKFGRLSKEKSIYNDSTFWLSTFYYNSKGLISKQINCLDSNFCIKIIFKYNKNRCLINKTSYSEYDDIRSIEYYKYNKKGKKIQEIIDFRENPWWRKTTYDYNTQGNLREKKEYLTEDYVVNSTIYFYDIYNNLTDTIELNSSNIPLKKTVYIFRR